MSQVVIPPDLNGYGEAYASAGLGRRSLLRLLGLAAAGAAAAGVILPLVPTTPFALVAAWAFARSSPRLEAWLLAHPRFGPVLAAWRERRAIPRRAKQLAVASLPVSWGGLWLADVGLAGLAAAGAVLALVVAWLLSRPS